ncbi:MAG: hypothetical protein RXO36_04540 [Candidatus Nanopusillus acidilobi]
MSNEQQNNEDIDMMGTEVFDEDIKAQEIIEQRLLEEKKKEEERRKKYENVTLKDIEEAIDLLTYFVEQSEKATQLLNRIKGQQRQLSPEEQFQLQLLKKIGQI